MDTLSVFKTAGRVSIVLRPDIRARIKAGDYPVVRQAGVAAGIVRVPTPLPVFDPFSTFTYAHRSVAEKQHSLIDLGKLSPGAASNGAGV